MRLRALVAAVLAAVVSCQLAFAATSHDPVEHSSEEHHGCVLCTLSHAHEVGDPILGEILSPLAARIEAPDVVITPRFAVAIASHFARGPPSPHV